jgi:hypothetical protein
LHFVMIDVVVLILYLRHSGHYGRAEAPDLTIPNR